jgi:hypothetical protein
MQPAELLDVAVKHIIPAYIHHVLAHFGIEERHVVVNYALDVKQLVVQHGEVGGRV